MLLLGAGGEGKSTAFLQCVTDIVRFQGWSALWRHNEDAKITADEIQNLARGVTQLLIAADDAHSLADDLGVMLSILKRRSIDNVHFFLAARTIDWRAVVREEALILSSSSYQEIVLKGVDEEDAERIIEIWTFLGKEGLGELYQLPRSEAVRRLREATVDDLGQNDEGALLGAMLQLRYGNRLKDKVRSILYRLVGMAAPGGTLVDAYGKIAMMHVEGLRFLSTPVLAQALGCSTSDLRRRVLAPLADEAIVAGGGRFILTRHREIAKVSVEIMQESNLYGDLEEVFPELARAAIVARISGQYVPELHRWDYDLPDHFLMTEQPILAAEVARTLQETDPTDIRLRVNASKIYREIGDPNHAARLFRNFSGELNRVAFTEWSVAEGNVGNTREAILLVAAGLCDLPGQTPPSRTSGRGVATLAFALSRLYEQTGDQTFKEGAAAARNIGLRFVNEETTKTYLDEILPDYTGSRPKT